MKTNRNLIGGSLRRECYDVYAEYFLKYIQANKQKGKKTSHYFYTDRRCIERITINNKGNDIYAITVQNEPKYSPANYPGMLMSAAEQTDFIANFLGPKLERANITSKIISYDHNYDDTDYPSQVTAGAKKYVAGAGFHHYSSYDMEDALLNYKSSADCNEKGIWMTECGFGTWMGSDVDQFQAQMKRLVLTSRYWSRG